MKLRFIFDDDNAMYKVMARRKSTGKWEQIGTCHLAARDAVKAGNFELLQWNIAR